MATAPYRRKWLQVSAYIARQCGPIVSGASAVPFPLSKVVTHSRAAKAIMKPLKLKRIGCSLWNSQPCWPAAQSFRHSNICRAQKRTSVKMTTASHQLGTAMIACSSECKVYSQSLENRNHYLSNDARDRPSTGWQVLPLHSSGLVCPMPGLP